MASKVQIADDIWGIMRKVYSIADNVVQSDRQAEFLNKVADYVEALQAAPPAKKKKG